MNNKFCLVFNYVGLHAKWIQSCPTLCNCMDSSLSGSSVHRILQEEYWGRLPFPPPGELPDLGIEPASLMSLALAGGFFITSTPWEAQTCGRKN